MLSVFYAKCRYAECCYTERHGALANVDLLSFGETMQGCNSPRFLRQFYDHYLDGNA
jgi:hypothetical protein